MGLGRRGTRGGMLWVSFFLLFHLFTFFFVGFLDGEMGFGFYELDLSSKEGLLVTRMGI